MPLTIPASLAEPVYHNNSLAIITENWIVVRDFKTNSQAFISIARLSRLKPLKTKQFVYLAFFAGSLLVSLAALGSPQGGGASLPLIGVTFTLLLRAQVTRQASIAFFVDSDVIQTHLSSLNEAAMLVAAVRAQERRLLGRPSPVKGYDLMRHCLFMLA